MTRIEVSTVDGLTNIRLVGYDTPLPIDIRRIAAQLSLKDDQGLKILLHSDSNAGVKVYDVTEKARTNG